MGHRCAARAPSIRLSEFFEKFSKNRSRLTPNGRYNSQTGCLPTSRLSPSCKTTHLGGLQFVWSDFHPPPKCNRSRNLLSRRYLGPGSLLSFRTNDSRSSRGGCCACWAETHSRPGGRVSSPVDEGDVWARLEGGTQGTGRTRPSRFAVAVRRATYRTTMPLPCSPPSRLVLLGLRFFGRYYAFGHGSHFHSTWRTRVVR